MLASASATRAQVMRVALLVLCVPSGANAQANGGGTGSNPCEGEWSVCDDSCQSEYTIYSPLTGDGRECPAAAGDTRRCSDGDACDDGRKNCDSSGSCVKSRCDGDGFSLGLIFVLFTVLFFNCIPAPNPDTAESPPPPRWFSRTFMAVFGGAPVYGALRGGCAIWAAIYLLLIVGVPVYMKRMHPDKSSLLTGHREVADTVVHATTNGIASSSDKEEPT